MERGQIRITDKTVHLSLSQGNVWLSQHQLADLFGVFVSKIGCNIRSIFKKKLLREQDVTHLHHFDGGSITLYNLEMISFLAFRIQSPQADIFRKWTTRKQTLADRVSEPDIVIYYPSRKNLC